MFMHLCVALALLAASLAGKNTSSQHTAKNSFITASAPTTHRACHNAYIGTIKIKSDALGKIFDHVFGQASIGTRRAGLGAVIALLNAADQGAICLALHIWMPANDFLGMHVGLLV